jgi:hypothetical protein
LSMDNKPDPNLDTPKREIVGDHIVITGNVGPGASIGRGSVQADYIAGRDLIVNGEMAEAPARFGDLLADLRAIVTQAKEAGELGEQVAKQILDNIDEATEIVKSNPEKPPKGPLIKRLESIADMLDAAVDVISVDGGIAKILLKAMPIAALLVKIAIRFF